MYLAGWALVIAAGAVLRFNPYSATAELQSDEPVSWRFASFDSPGAAVSLTARDVHPPLYYVLLWYWIRIFGDSEFAMRALSGLLGLLCVPATAWLARFFERPDERENQGRAVGLLSAALVAVSLPLVCVSVTARMYALLTLLVILSSGCLLKAMQRPHKRRWWLGWTLAAAAAAYTHYYGLFLIVAQAAWLGLELFLRWRRGAKIADLARQALLALSGIAALFGWWAPVFLHQAGELSGGRYWIDPMGWQAAAAIGVQWFTTPLYERIVPSMTDMECIAIGLVTLCLVVPWYWMASQRMALCVLGAFWVMPLFYEVATGTPILNPRYLIPLFPLFAILLAFWACRPASNVLRFALAAIVLGATAWPALCGRTWLAQQVSPIREAALYIRDHADPGDVILIRQWDISSEYYLTHVGTPCLRLWSGEYATTAMCPDYFPLLDAHSIHKAGGRPWATPARTKRIWLIFDNLASWDEDSGWRLSRERIFPRPGRTPLSVRQYSP